MRKVWNKEVSYFIPKSWGLMIAMVLAAAASIYAVADSQPQQSMVIEPAKPAAPVTAEEVSAFDPFHPQKAAAEVAEPGQTDLNNALPGSIVTPASYDIPAPLAETASEVSGEPADLAAGEGGEVQLAAVDPAREGRLGATRSGSPRSSPGQGSSNKNGSPSGGSGNYNWVLPTALIGAGATGVTLGIIGIVRNNSRNNDSKKAILSP